jgi:hypothetical protein
MLFFEIQYQLETRLTLLEICYNIPYVHRPGRNLSDPWSLRQTGVYQQLCNGLQTSRWILLNLSESTKLHLKDFVESRPNCCHLALHAELLLTLGSNWAEYIEYLSSELRKHVSDTAHVPCIRADDCRMTRRAILLSIE